MTTPFHQVVYHTFCTEVAKQTCQKSTSLQFEVRNLMHDVLALPYIEMALKCLNNVGGTGHRLNRNSEIESTDLNIRHVSPFKITRLQLFLILVPRLLEPEALTVPSSLRLLPLQDTTRYSIHPTMLLC